MLRIIFSGILILGCLSAAFAVDVSSTTAVNSSSSTAVNKPSDAPKAAAMTTEHKVKDGDTLWDLAGSYYSNAWQWQCIWEANKEMVSNPNLILPDQVLVIPDRKTCVKPKEKTIKKIMEPKAETAAKEEMKAVPEKEIEPEPEPEVITEKTIEPEAEEVIKQEPVKKEPRKEIMKKEETKDEGEYRAAKSFIADTAWEADGVITGDKDRKLLIAVGDTVYVDLGSDKVKPGTKCVIYRKISRVKDPQTKDFIGYEIKKVGRLEFTSQIGRKISTAEIIASYEPININDAVKIIKE